MTVTARTSDPSARRQLLDSALRLEYLTVGWNLVEGLIATGAALAAGSIALLAFGIDSFVESASGLVLTWRLLAEQRAHNPRVERLDRRAHQLVGISLFALAAYITFDAATSLIGRDVPKPSTVGIVLTTISIGVMLWLGWAKGRAAAALHSRAMAADAFQTTACWWLSVAALCGLGLNASFGWWWADPVAALVMAALIVREGGKAWRGEDCCD
jgi:divalent metal cation (Fe/Co/Zn/Cd) transporter